MNNVILFGRLVETPTLKMTDSGKAVCSFRLAVIRTYDRNKADFINCVTWQKSAELICKYKGKGDMIGVVGRIENRSWTDSEGAKRNMTEVVAEKIEFAGFGNGKRAAKPELGLLSGADYPSLDELPFEV